MRNRPAPSGTAHSDLNVTLRYHDATRAVLTAAGALSSATADVLMAVLIHHLHAGRRYVRLDLSALHSCDREGMNALVGAHHAFLEAPGVLVLLGARASVRQLLHRTGLDTVLFLTADRHRR
ncbi:MAG: anti-sigma factor antagonist [Pseudonocardiales bacterium]|nr:MAG: anti-sigma factor antagonist [Pseudonocardiales bacterium]